MMNNHDVNKLIEDALSASPSRDTFKNQLLQDSTAVFVRDRAFKRRLRMTGLILMILLVTTTAFISGRLSVSERIANQQVTVQSINEDNEGVRVSKDLVAWLDAARFFTRLGMDERAALSYKQASDLIPYDMPPINQQAGLETQSLYSSVGRTDASLEQIRSTTVLNTRDREYGLPNEMLSKMTTQHFWRLEP